MSVSNKVLLLWRVLGRSLKYGPYVTVNIFLGYVLQVTIFLSFHGN